MPVESCVALATPRDAPSAPVSATCANGVNATVAFMMSTACCPSRRSAFRPVATPVALVVNGTVVSPPLPTVIVPPCVPPVSNSNAKPFARLFDRMHGLLPFGVPPAPERHP